MLDLGEDRLEVFATLFVYRLADVIDAGFEVVPTYRSLHVTITFSDRTCPQTREPKAHGTVRHPLTTLGRANSTEPLANRVVQQFRNDLATQVCELISLIAVAQLIVRNLDEDLVQRLKRRAAAHGRSAEEEHRQLLRQVLRPEGLGEALLAMPNVAADADFDRLGDLPRELDLR